MFWRQWRGLLRDLMSSAKPWGDKVVCLGGYARQTPPIVKRGGRAHIVTTRIQMSPLSEKMETYTL